MPKFTSSWGVNPLALAQLIGAWNPYVEEKDWGDVRDALKAAFQIKEVRYLFEAEGENPPRLQLFQDLADSRDQVNHAQIEQLASVQKLSERYNDYKDRDVIRRILPYLLPVADAVFTTPDDPAAIPGLVVVGSYGNSMSTYIERDVSYLDPVQGMATDCYLISALIALAWARPKQWSARVNATVDRNAPTAPYRYQFYNARGTKDPTPVRVDMRLPELLGRPVYAHSTHSKEAWVAMFEKAYVMRRSLKPGEKIREPLPRDYRLISDSRPSPQKACLMLTGGASHESGPFAPMKPLAAVISLCDSRGVTREPTMASTWDRKWWSSDRTLRTLGFDRTGLMANHAYAVLGIVRQRVELPPDYVVLRNPWGRAPNCPDHKTGTWKPGDGESGVAEVELNRHGVFALKAEWFDKCFREVGWVTP